MRLYFYFFLAFSITACGLNNRDCDLSEDFLKEFKRGISEGLPPANSNLIMVFKLDDNSIVTLNNIELYEVYIREFKAQLDFDSYLCSLYNEEIFLKRDIFNNSGKVHSIVKSDISTEKLSQGELESRYCIHEIDHIKLKSSLRKDVKYAVLYSFFRNKMYISFDDYEGYYIIRKTL